MSDVLWVYSGGYLEYLPDTPEAEAAATKNGGRRGRRDAAKTVLALDPKLTRRLAAAYGVAVTADPVELQLRVMKIGEEFGEAIEALIGMQGWNPRKGHTHSLEDLETELADVLITAWVALATVSLEPDAVIDHRLEYVVERMEAA